MSAAPVRYHGTTAAFKNEFEGRVDADSVVVFEAKQIEALDWSVTREIEPMRRIALTDRTNDWYDKAICPKLTFQ